MRFNQISVIVFLLLFVVISSPSISFAATQSDTQTEVDVTIQKIYDAQGRLISIQESVDGQVVRVTDFVYDNYGRIVSEHYLENGIMVKVIEYVYEEVVIKTSKIFDPETGIVIEIFEEVVEPPEIERIEQSQPEESTEEIIPEATTKEKIRDQVIIPGVTEEIETEGEIIEHPKGKLFGPVKGITNIDGIDHTRPSFPSYINDTETTIDPEESLDDIFDKIFPNMHSGLIIIPEYKETKTVTISGMVDPFVLGTSITVTIEAPNGSAQVLEAPITGNGMFMVDYYITHDLPLGKFTTYVTYGKYEIDRLSFLLTPKQNVNIEFARFDACAWSEQATSNSRYLSSIQPIIPRWIIAVPGIHGDEEQVIKMNSKVTIPDWLQNNAKWWCEELISDEEFVNGITFLIDSNKMVLSNQQTGKTDFSSKESERIERERMEFDELLFGPRYEIPPQNLTLPIPDGKIVIERLGIIIDQNELRSEVDRTRDLVDQHKRSIGMNHEIREKLGEVNDLKREYDFPKLQPITLLGPSEEELQRRFISDIAKWHKANPEASKEIKQLEMELTKLQETSREKSQRLGVEKDEEWSRLVHKCRDIQETFEKHFPNGLETKLDNDEDLMLKYNHLVELKKLCDSYTVWDFTGTLPRAEGYFPPSRGDGGSRG